MLVVSCSRWGISLRLWAKGLVIFSDLDVCENLCLEVAKAMVQCTEEKHGVSGHLVIAGVGVFAIGLHSTEDLPMGRIRVIGGS